MRHALPALLLILPFVGAEPGDADASRPRELKVEKVPPLAPGRTAGFGDPVKVTSARQLEEAVPDRATRDGIARGVDFGKEYVLVFRWAGSGGDRVTMTSEDKAAVFTFTAGRTRDLRSHLKAFALPKGMTWKTAR